MASRDCMVETSHSSESTWRYKTMGSAYMLEGVSVEALKAFAIATPGAPVGKSVDITCNKCNLKKTWPASQLSQTLAESPGVRPGGATVPLYCPKDTCNEHLAN